MLFLLWMIIFSLNSSAQDTSLVKKHKPVKTIWDIPHKTLWQKWMWIHRSVVFEITRPRPVKCDTNYIKFYRIKYKLTNLHKKFIKQN